MHPSELKLVDIARRYVAVGMQAASAYNSEQAQLQLDFVLSQERLSTEAGTDESRQVLGQLRQLTEAHKLGFQRLVLAITAEIGATLAELPADLQAESQVRLVSSLNWQLDAQARFYATRERWLDAAEEICDLIDAHRSTATFGADGVDFESAEALARFSELLGVIEEAHQSEVAAIRERMDRLAQAFAVLNGAAPR